MRDTDPTFGDLRDLRNQMLVYARHLSRNRANAEDMVQSAILKMLANRHRFTVGHDVGAWARAILRNECRTAERNARRWPMMPVPETLQAPDDSFTAVYCYQVGDMLGLDAVMLLAEPVMTSTQRVRLRRARVALEARVAA